MMDDRVPLHVPHIDFRKHTVVEISDSTLVDTIVEVEDNSEAFQHIKNIHQTDGEFMVFLNTLN